MHQVTYGIGKFEFGTSTSYQGMPKTCLWLNEDEKIAGTIPFVLINLPPWLTVS